MKSKYKNLINVDYSGNSIYNISRLIGNEYSRDSIQSDPRKNVNEKRTEDFLITTAGDSEHSTGALVRPAGNLLLRAGVSTQGSGYVHAFAGEVNEEETPTDRGILLHPDSNIYIASNKENIYLGAKKNITQVGLEEISLSNLLNKSTNKNVDNVITLKKNGGTADTPSIDIISPNLNIHYNKSLSIENTGDNTTFIARVDKLDVETSYRISADNIIDAPAYKLSITGANSSSVSIKDITSYGLITALNFEQTGNFTFKNTFKSDGKGTPNEGIHYDRKFLTYGQEFLGEFRNINLHDLGSSINGDTKEGTGNFALLANKDVKGLSNFSKLYIQYIEATKDVAIWGDFTVGKDETRTNITLYSSNFNHHSDNSTEEHKVYKLTAGIPTNSSDEASYIVEANTTSRVTLDNLISRNHIDALNTMDVYKISTFHDDIILEGATRTIKSGETNENIVISAKNNVKIEQKSRYLLFDENNKFELFTEKGTFSSNEPNGSFNFTLNGANNSFNIDTTQDTGLVDINSKNIKIYQGTEDSAFNLKVNKDNTSYMQIQDINLTGKQTSNNMEINGDFNFNPKKETPEAKKNFIITGNKYSQKFDYIDEHCPEGNIRILAYNKLPESLDIPLPNYPSGLAANNSKDYSLIQAQNLELSSYGWIRGSLDIHQNSDAIKPTEFVSIRTKDLNIASENIEQYGNEFNAYFGYTLPTVTSNETIPAFGEFKADSSKDKAKYRLNISPSSAKMWLDYLTASTHILSNGTLKVEGKSTLHDIDLIDGDRTVTLTGSSNTLTYIADNYCIQSGAHKFIELLGASKKAIVKGTILDLLFGDGNHIVNIQTGKETSALTIYDITALNHILTTTLKASASLSSPDVTVDTILKSNTETIFKGKVTSGSKLSEFNIEAAKGIVKFADTKFVVDTTDTYTATIDTLNITTKQEIDAGATFNVECAENLNNTLNMKATGGVIQASGSNNGLTLNANAIKLNDTSGTYTTLSIDSTSSKSDVVVKTGAEGTLKITSHDNLTIDTTGPKSLIDVDQLEVDTSHLATTTIDALTVTASQRINKEATFTSEAKSFQVTGGDVDFITSGSGATFKITGQNGLVINDSDARGSLIQTNIAEVDDNAKIAVLHVVNTSTFDDKITLSGTEVNTHTIEGTKGVRLLQGSDYLHITGGKSTLKTTTLEVASGNGASSLTEDSITTGGLWIGHLSGVSKVIAYNLIGNTSNTVQSNIKNLDVSATTQLKGTLFESTAADNNVTGNINLNASGKLFDIKGTTLVVKDNNDKSTISATDITGTNSITSNGTLKVNGTSEFDNLITLTDASKSKHTIEGTTGLYFVSNDEAIYLTNGVTTFDSTTTNANINNIHIKNKTGAFESIGITNGTDNSVIDVKTGATGSINVASKTLLISTKDARSNIEVDDLTVDTENITTSTIGDLSVTASETLEEGSTFTSNAKSFQVNKGDVDFTTSGSEASFKVTGHNNLIINDSDSTGSKINVNDINVTNSTTTKTLDVNSTSDFANKITLSGASEPTYTIEGSTGVKLLQGTDSFTLTGGKTTLASRTLEITSGADVEATPAASLTRNGLWIGYLTSGDSSVSKVVSYDIVAHDINVYKETINDLIVNGTTDINGTSFNSSASSFQVTSANVSFESNTGFNILGNNGLSINDKSNNSIVKSKDITAANSLTSEGTLSVSSTSTFNDIVTLSGGVAKEEIQGTNGLKLSSGTEYIKAISNTSLEINSKNFTLKGNSTDDIPSKAAAGKLLIKQTSSESTMVVNKIITSDISGVDNITGTNGTFANLDVTGTTELKGTSTSITSNSTNITSGSVAISSTSTLNITSASNNIKIDNNSIYASNSITAGTSISSRGTLAVTGNTTINTFTASGKATLQDDLAFQKDSTNITAVNTLTETLNTKNIKANVIELFPKTGNGYITLDATAPSSKKALISVERFNFKSGTGTGELVINNTDVLGSDEETSYIQSYETKATKSTVTDIHVENSMKVKDFTMYWSNESNSLVFARA